MRLYLVRHGQALPGNVDPAKGLSDTGRGEAERVAAFLRKLEIEVGAVWESGKKRATQTAQILGSAVRATAGIQQRQGLQPNDPVAPMVRALSSLDEDHMIVGHLPFLADLASALLVGRPDAEPVLRFRPATVVCLERTPGNGWIVNWSISPSVL